MTERPRRTFAERLDHLFREVHPDSRGPYSYAEVAQGIKAAGEGAITASGIQQLRTGTRGNPKMATIKALADFFGVPAGYFFDDEVAEHTEAEIQLVAAMRDEKIAQVALRSAGLSTASLKMVHTVIAQARHLEGLPAGDDFPGFDLNE
ncbi:helix-turn-helix domain-containing protein [Kitasatospora sp. NBC_01287]|uniref:helix-turn-helix domain-containing protein n=1 Tax=Kitasatospora sp. NBC_01287 TaxID=2903573 RepID=UPI00224F64C1|nr:helix-turn-helix domain-containing protein [Kitasatospora sp. NBC_01287]MCX4751218.1 helix-turn-helix domain-containing protein [Kitasatospora sp. NBC_01287]